VASDTTLNRYLIYGTHAERLSFTPNPASLSGIGPGDYVNVLWTESDIAGNPTYAWNQAGTAWVLTSGSGGGAGSGAPGPPGPRGGDGTSRIVLVAQGGATLSTAVKTRAITFTVTGNGSAPSAGVAGDLYIPYACTITAATVLGNVSGSIVLDVWAQPFSSGVPTVTQSIVASDPPTLSSAQSVQDTTLTGWTTAIAASTWMRLNVNSASTLTSAVLILTVTVI
jgi:hypothetical protein